MTANPLLVPAALGALLLLTSCVGGGGATDPGTSHPAVPVVTPTEDATDPSTWRIDFDGIGPIDLGSGADDARSVLIGIDSDGDVDACPPTMSSDNGSLMTWVSLGADNAVTMVSIDGYLDVTKASAVSPTTAEGIGLGASLDELEAAYPGIAGRPAAGDDWLYEITDGETRIDFGVRDDVVAAIVVVNWPVRHAESCG